MGITREIPAGEPFELAGRIVGLERETGRAGRGRRGDWRTRHTSECFRWRIADAQRS